MKVIIFFNWSIFDVLASQVAVVVQNSAYNGEELRDRVLIPGMGRSPGGGHGNPFQYSCLKNPMDTGTWQATIHRVAQSWNDWCDLACLHIWCTILYVVCILSYFSFFRFFENPQTPLSMGLSGQEYWSGLPFPPSKVLPNPRMEPSSPLATELADEFFATESPGKHPQYYMLQVYNIVIHNF